MLTKIKTRKDGFTIVEIMIVMAIIGLMLLAMLLVVPSLRRNQRNKQRRDDVGALITAMSEYQTNNSGALPSTAQFSQIIGTSGGNYTDGLARLGYYDPATEVDYAYSTTAVSTIAGATTGVVYVRNFAKCSNNAVTSTGATRRNVIAYYNVETSGGFQPQCQES